MNNQEELLMKFCKCETTPQEDKILADWLEENPEEGRKAFDQIHAIFLNTTLFPEKFSDIKKKPRHKLLFRRLGLYASGIAAAVLILIGTIHITKHQTQQSFAALTQEVSVPHGQRIKISLTDGTKVWLNSGTRIEYPAVFPRNSRRVYIDGEARFEVAHNTESPFTVETFVSEIEVLGTIFNVVAEEATGKFSTTLVEGKVRVINMIDEIVMKPNDIVTFSNGRLYVDKVTDNANAIGFLCSSVL